VRVRCDPLILTFSHEEKEPSGAVFFPSPGPLLKGEGDNRAKGIIISSHRGRGGKQSEGANHPLSLRVKGKK
jgi:hypothetical protein